MGCRSAGPLHITFRVFVAGQPAPGVTAVTGQSWHRGRMPVFSYLTDDEGRAAYTYLVLYPPEER